MFYTVYKITNKINNKYYIGMHKTANIDDGYMGSGKLIRSAIDKHGAENFFKEILHIFDNEEDMRNKEKELVVLNEMSYNLCDGGKGGFGFINKTINLQERNRQINRRKNYNDPQFRLNLSNAVKKSVPHRRKALLSEESLRRRNESFLGKKHSAETKHKISIKAKERLNTKEKNSQFGTCWITNGKENKKIKKEALDIWIKNGYTKGRVIPLTPLEEAQQ